MIITITSQKKKNDKNKIIFSGRVRTTLNYKYDR